MTPQQHIDKAEGLVAKAQLNIDDGLAVEDNGELLLAIAHALIAVAVENGVPHSTPAPEGA